MNHSTPLVMNTIILPHYNMTDIYMVKEGNQNMEEEVLASLSFQLAPSEKSISFLKSKEFPIALKPESLVKAQGGRQIHYANSHQLRASGLQTAIPRPRNRFILARSILSKIITSRYSCSTDDTSRIISVIWAQGEGEFQEYFKYLSFIEDQWHEIYFPSYSFTPKVKTANTSGAPQTLKEHRPSLKTTYLFVNDRGSIPETPRSFNKANAQDIQDMKNYVELCSTSYGRKNDIDFVTPVEEASNYDLAVKYKKHTSKFSIRKTRVKSMSPSSLKKKSIKEKVDSTRNQQFIITTINSSMFGKTEDVYIIA